MTEFLPVLPQSGCNLFGRQMFVKLADLVMKIYTNKTKQQAWRHYSQNLRDLCTDQDHTFCSGIISKKIISLLLNISAVCLDGLVLADLAFLRCFATQISIIRFQKRKIC